MKIFYYIILLLFTSLYTQAQDILGKRVSVNYKNASATYILSDIKQQYHINFSYASNLFNKTNAVTLKADNITVKEVLKKILAESNIQYGQKGSVIILRKVPAKQTRTPQAYNLKITNNTAAFTNTDIVADSISISPENNIFEGSNDSSVSQKNSFVQDTIKPTDIVDAIAAKHSSQNRKYYSRAVINSPKGKYNSSQLGLLNIAHNVNGSQIGVVNIAKTVSGRQLGLVNISKYHKIELSAFGNFAGNFFYKTGSQSLHSIFAVGVKLSDDPKSYLPGIGYGFGSEIRMAGKNLLDLNVILYQMKAPGCGLFNKLNLLGQFRVNWGYTISNRFVLFMGPEICLTTHHIPTSANNDHDEDDYRRNNNSNAFHKPKQDKDLSFQPGFNLGIRF